MMSVFRYASIPDAAGVHSDVVVIYLVVVSLWAGGRISAQVMEKCNNVCSKYGLKGEAMDGSI